MKTVRVDAVCAGATGRTHAETLKTSAVGAELVAVSDPDAARAEAVACGAAHVFANALRLIELPEVGAVVVASPDERREKQVAASIADGKPVLCEKAPASSSEAFARHSWRNPGSAPCSPPAGEGGGWKVDGGPPLGARLPEGCEVRESNDKSQRDRSAPP